MLYYYERTKTMRGPFKVQAESDEEAIAEAQKRCEEVSDPLLVVYTEDFRTVWEEGERVVYDFHKK